MIPTFTARAGAVLALGALTGVSVGAAPGAAAPGIASPVCLPSGDGYLRARLAGAIETTIDWPNSGTHCQGESRDQPPGVRLSFERPAGAKPNLLIVFGLTGVKRGLPAKEVGANLTVVVQGTGKIYGTIGDTRCTVDSLVQTPLNGASFRIEARGFCTQPAHAVRGNGDILVSTFEFAGPVTYEVDPAASTEIL